MASSDTVSLVSEAYQRQVKKEFLNKKKTQMQKKQISHLTNWSSAFFSHYSSIAGNNILLHFTARPI